MTAREELSPQWRARLARHGLEALGALLRSGFDETRCGGVWEILTKPGLGGRRRWRWTLTPERDEYAKPASVNSQPPTHPVLYVKRYCETPLTEQWDRIRRQHIRGSRAAWEHRQALRLEEAHIGVAHSVGFAEDMFGPFERRSVVLLEAAPGDGFDRVWSALESENAPITRGAARREITARLARFVAAFHETGCCHRDLYLCHIFADIEPRGERPPRFTLIDLARTHYPRLRRMRWILKDLAQLDCSARRIGASRADRWRFLLNYLNLPRRASRARWYARRIARKSDHILARDERKQARP